MGNKTKRRRLPARKAPRPTERRSSLLWLGFLIPLVVVAAIMIAGSLSGEPSSEIEGGPAPGFSLPNTTGQTVSLDEILSGGDDALLYFSMGVGCDGCFAQIPEAVEGLGVRGVRLVPVMADPADEILAEAGRFGIATPILVDRNREVPEAYGMLGGYGHSDRPSHSSALVHRVGTVGWVKHYPTMFVPFEQLLGDRGMAAGGGPGPRPVTGAAEALPIGDGRDPGAGLL